MPKPFPYFRWYAADAETDENYSSLNDMELGFFHRCLNRSWINDGLPADLDKLALAMHVRRSYLDKVWPKVSKCFSPHATVENRIVNPRQEREREHAASKSLANQRIGNANAKRTERVRNANDPQQARARADLSLSDSGVVVLERGVGETKSNGNGKVPAVTRQRFDEWIRPWPRMGSEENALHAFVFAWTAEEDAEMFACRDRFLASRDAAEGVCQNPERFLCEQKASGWRGKWPPASKPSGKESRTSVLDRVLGK